MPRIFPRDDEPQRGGRRRSRRRRLAIVAGGVAAGVLLLGAGVVGLFVAVYGFDTNVSKRVSGQGTQVVRIALSDFDVTPGTLVVDRGTHLVLNVVNEGDEAHDLALEDGRLRTRMLEPASRNGSTSGKRQALSSAPSRSTDRWA
jgi:hypothetical protein